MSSFHLTFYIQKHQCKVTFLWKVSFPEWFIYHFEHAWSVVIEFFHETFQIKQAHAVQGCSCSYIGQTNLYRNIQDHAETYMDLYASTTPWKNIQKHKNNSLAVLGALTPPPATLTLWRLTNHFSKYIFRFFPLLIHLEHFYYFVKNQFFSRKRRKGDLPPPSRNILSK